MQVRVRREMRKAMREVNIAYGKGTIPLRLDPDVAEWHVLEPIHEPPLPDPHEVFVEACKHPVGTSPLDTIVGPDDKVIIVTSDGTRPVPNRNLIPWLIEELNVPAENVVVLLGNGTHRANSRDEIVRMFGTDVARQVHIYNHNAYDPDRNEPIGTTSSGAPVLVDKLYLEADKRIVLGYIEPHFFAGFSGGAKGVFPGVAGLDTIMDLHNYDIIAHPGSTWGELDDNPVQREIGEMAALCPPDFMVNVTLNSEKEITGIFSGHYREAHRQGCDRAASVSMTPVSNEFPIVVTSNSGYPLDQNVYQAVKGMSAAARIVEHGGVILMACECSDGIPDHGNFGSILRDTDTPEAVDQWIKSLDKPILDQWQAQLLAAIMKRASVAIYSSLDRSAIESAMLVHIDDLQTHVETCIRAHGSGTPVAVLPDGPLTIPYIAG